MNTTNTVSPKHSIRTRLIGTMAVMLVIILLMNMFIYLQINTMAWRIDSVFESNVSIGELRETLDHVQENVHEYLNTKSSEALENYYRYVQDYHALLSGLNERITDNATAMLEKNIRNMSQSYLDQADETVSAKRGRNVEKYKTGYQQTSLLYRYIDAYIYQLNQARFEQNSQNYQVLLSVVNVLEIFSLAIMIVIFMICLGLIVLTIHAMIGPLSQLSEAAALVAKGNFDVQIPEPTSEDEIGIVTKTFAQMLQSIRAYIARLRTSMETEARMKERELSMEASLKEAQLRFLQAQINPHFLFNSLNAGTQLAMMEDAEATGVFLEKLAEFYRYNLQRGDGMATLAEEIELVDNYIYILNVRFAGDITYEKDVEEGIGQVPMPGMILQPLVENAVNHGIRDRMDQGKIVLTAEKDERGILVTIADNGRGMSREEMDYVQSKLSDREEPMITETRGTSGSSTGIGLENVARRLNLFYHQEELLFIHSEGRGRGVEVTLRLPASDETAMEENH